ncbi:hypothetical protein MB02_04995 [Croceicoccus estronivorus]|uniref:lysozyme inhibitor LprI family protein n=1 Tax=Croceicoccus estronivorus TaxID=1172626 RepID=UPI00082BFA44|nr:lysozyme inhibitor LprI family protein [Croceicoccus estronivorus]OCC24824.1 hypothetical protein MB02_04995 [Croceicoccus estronivorus]
MIASLVLAAAAGSAATPPNPGWNCDDPVAQQEMNWCAAQEYVKADGELNAQWAITAADMKAKDKNLDRTYDERPGYFETLLSAQRAWIAYRDAHCASEGFWARGGSLEPLLVSTCKTKLTQERTQQLQFLVEQ